jgi:hypothetical protein
MRRKVSTLRQSRLKQWLKRSSSLRSLAGQIRAIRREVVWITNAARSERFSALQKNRALSRQLRGQKTIVYTIALPPLRGFRSLTDWLDDHAVHYIEGGFCIYIPPQELSWKLFGPILSAYPPDSGLKILKDLKPPAQAMYVSKAIRPNTTKASELATHRPMDLVRVANYMYHEGIGPRVYDLIEIQTPYNSLSAYVIQHVVGTAPSVDEYTAFLNRLDQLSKDQLIPPPGWKGVGGRTRLDFRCPDCNGNLLIDKRTGDALYVDFQGFVIKDVRQYILGIVDEIRENVQFRTAQGTCGENDLYQSILVLNHGQQTVEPRWNLFKQTLERQGFPIEGAVVLDVGHSAGITIYAALTDGAAWAIGWDKPVVAATTRKLMFALGMTRFDVVGQDTFSDTDFLSFLPPNAKSAENVVLFFRAMRKHDGLFHSIKNLPFKYMVYEGHRGEAVTDIENYLKDIANRWNLQIVDVVSYRDQGSRECPVVILRRS